MVHRMETSPEFTVAVAVAAGPLENEPSSVVMPPARGVALVTVVFRHPQNDFCPKRVVSHCGSARQNLVSRMIITEIRSERAETQTRWQSLSASTNQIFLP